MQDQHSVKQEEGHTTPPLTRRESFTSHNHASANKTMIKKYLTKEIIQECLWNLDIFRNIMQDPNQRPKLQRDVYYEGDAVYRKGDNSLCLYMVLKGEISLCMPISRERTPEQQQKEPDEIIYDYLEVDSFQEGMGFGESDFVQKKKRDLEARVKQDETILAVLSGEAFEEIIELYKQRVYYKKLQIFGKSPFLKNLQPYQLQFIVNNTKPVVFSISKVIASQGQYLKAIYLITEGQVQMRQECFQEKKRGQKCKTQQNGNRKASIRKNHLIGIKNSGQFIGDGEIMLGIGYQATYICKSQKVKAYMCSKRIIMSQMNDKIIEQVRSYYQAKMVYMSNKIQNQKRVIQQFQQEISQRQPVHLNPVQLKIKRKLNQRYIQKNASFIGMFSPRQINKMVDRKVARLNSQVPLRQTPFLPHIKIFRTPKLKNMRSVSPSKHSQPFTLRRSVTLKQDIKQVQEFTFERSITLKPEHQQTSQKKQISLPYTKSDCIANCQEQNLRSQTQPLLAFMQPYKNKVLSLHERLPKQQRIRYKNQQIKQILRQRSKLSHGTPKKLQKNEFSIVQMRRLCQFVSKLKTAKKRKRLNPFRNVKF